MKMANLIWFNRILGNKMKIQLILKGIVFLFCIISTGCHQPSVEDFTFSYTAESINNYKCIVTVCSDSIYKIEKFNYYMDNFEGKQRPEIQEGRLTVKQFEILQHKLEESNLFSMSDSYGFEENETRWSTSSDIIHQVYYSEAGKEKFITCKSSAELPQSFIRLVKYVNTLLSD